MIPSLDRPVRAAGFAAYYVLPPEPFPYYERRLQDGALHRSGQKLVSNPKAFAPWANALLLLVYPYRPFTSDVPVAGNYPANHRSYFSVRALAAELSHSGMRAEPVYVPFRELAMRSGIGKTLQNGLISIEPFGTRFSVQMLAALLDQPVSYDAIRPTRYCADCGACRAACPVGAIDESGFHYSRCARAYMDERTGIPEWAMRAMTRLIGCDQCQEACPENAGLDTESVASDAFEFERLLRGDTADAAALVGRNVCSGGRLTAQAAVLAGNRGHAELMPLLEGLLYDERIIVANAARYAISRLRNG